MKEFTDYNAARNRMADLLKDKYNLPSRIIQELLELGRANYAMAQERGMTAAYSGTATSLHWLCDMIERGEIHS